MQKADKATQHRQPACQRASFGALLDATGEIGAEIGRTQPIDRTEARQLSQMLGQKLEKQRQVAPVSGDRMSRGTPFAREPSGPQPDRCAQVIGCREPGQRYRLRQSRKTRLRRVYRLRSSHWAMVISRARARKVSSSVPSPG